MLRKNSFIMYKETSQLKLALAYPIARMPKALECINQSIHPPANPPRRLDQILMLCMNGPPDPEHHA